MGGLSIRNTLALPLRPLYDRGRAVCYPYLLTLASSFVKWACKISDPVLCGNDDT